MGDFKRNHPGRQIIFSGGVFTDLPLNERPCEDLLNLMPPVGALKGLRPRHGCEFVITLETAETLGGIIHEVTVDEMSRTRLLTVMDAASGKVLRITDHTDQEGKTEMAPLGGGELPVTEEEEPDYANTLRFESETAQVDAGGSVDLTVIGTNSGGTCGVALDLITAVDGEDINDDEGSVTANSVASGTVTISTLPTATQGRVFDVYLYNPLAASTYLKDPTRCRVTIGQSISATFAPMVMDYDDVAGTITLYSYDANANEMVGPTTLTSAIDTSFFYVFRTENYLCVFESRENTDTHARFRAWPITALAADPTGSHAPTVDIAAYPFIAASYGNYPSVFPYAGDVVYVLDDHNFPGSPDIRLAKIDIATEAVTLTSVTGMPATFNQAGLSSWCISSVDTNGDLWVFHNDTVTDNIVKINPATAVATYEPVPVGRTLQGTFAPAASGQMIYQDFSTNNCYIVSADMTTHTLIPNSGGVGSLGGDSGVIQGAFKGDKAIGAAGGSLYLLNTTSGTATDTGIGFTRDSYRPACYNVDYFFILTTDTGGSPYVSQLNKISAAGALVEAVDTTTLFASNDPPGIVIPDGFGYVVTNIQGSRL